MLPNIWRQKTIHIYFKEIDTDTLRGLTTLVHECFHVLQYQDLQKRYEIGMFRKFLIYYIAYYLEGIFKYIRKYPFVQASQKAYYFHPMEIPAYQHDSLMTKAGSAFLYQKKSLILLKNPDILTNFLQNNPQLIKYSSGILLNSPTYFSKITSTLLCTILFFINPFLELLFKIIFYFSFVFSKKKPNFVL